MKPLGALVFSVLLLPWCTYAEEGGTGMTLRAQPRISLPDSDFLAELL